MTIISQTHGFVLVHIPYCGGERIKRAYQPYARWCDLILGSTSIGLALEPAYRQQFGIGQYATLNQIEKVLGQDLLRFERLALIRHPEERIEGMYQLAIRELDNYARGAGISAEEAKTRVRQGQAPRDLLQRTPILAMACTSSADDWVKKLLELSSTVGGVSLLSHFHWLKADSGLEVKHRFHWENLDAVWPFLEQRIGRPLRDPNALAATPSPAPQADFQLSSASRQLLRESLKADYTELGYGLERPDSNATTAFQF